MRNKKHSSQLEINFGFHSENQNTVDVYDFFAEKKRIDSCRRELLIQEIVRYADILENKKSQL